MNALARISPARETPLFDAIGEIAAALGAPVPAGERLRRVLETLAQLGLTEGGVAAVEGRMLRGLAGRQSGAPPQGMTPRLTAFLKAGKAGILRREKPPTLGAPIRSQGEIVGLLAAQVQGREIAEDDLNALALVANLLGPAILLARSGAEAGAPPEAIDAKAIIGDSPALRAALDLARRVAPTDLPVLLRGESGAGKEMFAHFIHDYSRRAKKPFVKVNCAALPETLLEAELFGHERGAFTGALRRREGRFELADGGTILLDEIGEISLSFQLKLLRVLQTGEFERVGGEKTLRVNTRVIAATNGDLESAVRAGKFRADLYYRLAVAALTMAPLRERREDIPALSENVLTRFNAENGRSLTLHPRAFTLLSKCAFPGNIRELENCVRSAAALVEGDVISEQHFACRQGRCFSARLRRAQIAHARKMS